MRVEDWAHVVLDALHKGPPLDFPLDREEILKRAEDVYLEFYGGDPLTNEERHALIATTSRFLLTLKQWQSRLEWDDKAPYLYEALVLLLSQQERLKSRAFEHLTGYLSGKDKHAARLKLFSWALEDVAENVAEQWVEATVDAHLDHLRRLKVTPAGKMHPSKHLSFRQGTTKHLRALADEYVEALTALYYDGIEAAPKPMKAPQALTTSKPALNIDYWAPHGAAEFQGKRGAHTIGTQPGDLIATLHPHSNGVTLNYKHVAVSDAIGALKHAVDGEKDTSTVIGLSDIARNLMQTKGRLAEETLEEIEGLVEDLATSRGTFSGLTYNGDPLEIRGYLVAADRLMLTHPNGALSIGYRVLRSPLLYEASAALNQAKVVEAALKGYSPGRRRTLAAMFIARYVTGHLPYWYATKAKQVAVYIEPPTKKPRHPVPVLATALGRELPLTRRQHRTLFEYLEAALEHLTRGGYISNYEDLYEGRKKVGVTLSLPTAPPPLDHIATPPTIESRRH